MPNQLTKKIGPLPTWAYIAGGILFVGMVWYMRRNASSDVSATDTGYEPAQSSTALAPDTQYIGSSDGSLYGSGVYSDVPVGTDMGTPVGYPPDFLSTLLAGVIQNGLSGGPTIYENPSNPLQTNPEPGTVGTQAVATKTATAKQTSFQWGGKTWTRKDLAAFRKWLTAHGSNYSAWAKNHPKAAMDVFGTMK